VLAKPRTYMNLSGQAARYLRDRFSASPKQILVICDDMDLPAGKLRLRADGSAGGHNGLKSIINDLGSQDFPRLRIGIGRPRGQTGNVDYVLGEMSRDERALVHEAIGRTADAVAALLAGGIDRAMNTYN